jgi:sugar-specific transcriptional regulator TrmB
MTVDDDRAGRPGVSATLPPVSTDRALDLLKGAGLSGYEGKAYLALLAAGEPLNGYEVAKSSGVPRSTVYETLSKLVGRGAAFEVNGKGDGVLYVPLPSDALIGRLRREASETIDGLESVLPTIGRAATRVVQHLSGAAEVTNRTIDVIDSAQRTLWFSIWPQETAPLVAPTKAAVERGVDVFVISYGEVELPGRVYRHRYSSPEMVAERLQCRLSIVVADHDQATIGGVTTDQVWGMWSDDQAVALLAAEHVRHDIALHVLADHMEQSGLLPDFWTNAPELEALRDASAAAVSANAR